MNTEIKMTKLQISIMMVLVLFLSVTGFTYAYFAASDNNTGTITGNLATVNLTLTVDKLFPAEDNPNTGVLVPQLSVSENEVSPLASALKNGCVDANNNVVCQAYKIVIQNKGGTATQVVDGTISFFSDAAFTTDVSTVMPSLRWKLITSVNTTTPTNSSLGSNADLVANFNKNIFANDVTLSTDVSRTYYIIIWINETDADQPVDEGKSFYGKIEFNSSNGTGVTATFAS